MLLEASPRLRRLGIDIPDLSVERPYKHRLYERLEDRLGNSAYSYYNSLFRRIISFAKILEREASRSK